MRVFLLLLLTIITSAAAEPRVMSAEDAKAFMKELCQFVHTHHLKKTNSPQKGMVYEYVDMVRLGKPGKWVQGEALDTMHDGAWFAASLVNAYRATGDAFYRETLREYLLPFYLKMLNHSDELFSPDRNDARNGSRTFDREHQLQKGEKGFVPYWWDDGASVSLERRLDKNRKGPFPCTDQIPPDDNTNYVLSGYSHGSSNHMAQDLGVMLQLAWQLFNDTDPILAKELRLAAINLHQARLRHHGHIPMTDAPVALAAPELGLLKYLPDPASPENWKPRSRYFELFYNFKEDSRGTLLGFADDQHYTYYTALARNPGQLPAPIAFRIIYEAFTGSIPYSYYSDDQIVEAGINIFDLHPYHTLNGKLMDYRSEKRGHHGKPRPEGSRFGPQNMVCAGWALQALRQHPDIYEAAAITNKGDAQQIYFMDLPPQSGPPFPNAFSFRVGDTEFKLVTTRSNLHVEVSSMSDEVEFSIATASSNNKGGGRFTVTSTEAPKGVNHKGEALLIENASSSKQGRGLRSKFQVPYTVVKNQRHWINGIEHALYRLECNSETQDLYFASEEEPVRLWLEYELGRGLLNWKKIFREKGFIPTGLGTGTFWDRYSDSGGYAHLISAAAQWILYLDGKSDWK